MSDKLKKNIRLIYGIVLSLLLLITGLLLILSCISIYNLGDRPFTVENISSAFSRIKIPVIITLSAVIIGAILQLFFPQEKGKIRSTPDKRKLAQRLERRVDFSACGAETIAAISKQKKARAWARVVCAVYFMMSMTPALVCALNVSNYSLESYNESVIAVCFYVIPCSLVALSGLALLSYFENITYDIQILHLKNAIKHNTKKDNAVLDYEKDNGKGRFLIAGARTVVLIIAILFIIEGISNGGMSDVLIKAINICTECIGLG